MAGMAGRTNMGHAETRISVCLLNEPIREIRLGHRHCTCRPLHTAVDPIQLDARSARHPCIRRDLSASTIREIRRGLGASRLNEHEIQMLFQKDFPTDRQSFLQPQPMTSAAIDSNVMGEIARQQFHHGHDCNAPHSMHGNRAPSPGHRKISVAHPVPPVESN